MPYITEDRRDALDNNHWKTPENAGELNYKITTTVVDFVRRKGVPRYQDFNDAIGALECAKLELYRRMIAPYEDRKRLLNGDVY